MLLVDKGNESPEETLNILFLLTDRFDRGGVQSDMLALAEMYSSMGIRMTVAAPAGAQVESLLQRGAHFRAMPDPLAGPLGLAAFTARLAWILARERFDVIAPQSVRTTLAASLARRFHPRSIPIVTTIHNQHNPALTRRAAAILARHADALTFESDYERQLMGLSAVGVDGAVEVVRSGIDLDRFQPRATDQVDGYSDIQRPLVGCVARLSSEKSHLTLLDAWRIAVERGTAGTLLLIGDGPERERIEKAISSWRLNDRVRLLGDRGDVDRILPTLDLFVLSSSRESYPLSAREAMASGVPAILPEIGGCHEVTGDLGGETVTPDDPLALAECLCRWLASDPDTTARRIAAGVAARNRAEQRFDRWKWAQGLRFVYQRSFHTSRKEPIQSENAVSDRYASRGGLPTVSR
jgi:L-malate glycosyltransferase